MQAFRFDYEARSLQKSAGGAPGSNNLTMYIA
jgi:hypothetical protein